MINLITGRIGFFADFGMSGLALLVVIPVGAVIWLDIKMVNYCLKKGGSPQYLGVIGSFIVACGLLAYGGWGIFNDFSLINFFITVGGGLILIFSIRSATFINEPDSVKNKHLD